MFEAHRRLYHSTLGLRVIKKKKKVRGVRILSFGCRVSGIGMPLHSEFWVLGFGFGIWGLGFRVWGLGLGSRPPDPPPPPLERKGAYLST